MGRWRRTVVRAYWVYWSQRWSSMLSQDLIHRALRDLNASEPSLTLLGTRFAVGADCLTVASKCLCYTLDG